MHSAKTRIELYDLEKDVSETKDVSGRCAEILKHMIELMRKAHTFDKMRQIMREYLKLLR